MKHDHPETQIARLTRRSLLWSAAAVGGAYGVWRWLVSGKPQEGLPPAFRKALGFNESLWSRLSTNARLSPTFPPSAVEDLRVNGMIGLRSPLDVDYSHFEVTVRSASGTRTRLFPAIRTLPEVSVVTEHRCIEGWSNVVRWTGTPLRAFLASVGLEGVRAARYFQAATPDGKYYASLDREAALHPQTLLCWALNGEPLTPEHGAPLRLVVPVKYGIKSLKRVGVIRLTDEEPPDYWRERAYDGYAGL